MPSFQRESLATVADCLVARRRRREPITVGAEDSCQWALRVMNAANVDRLPVLEGDRVVGIITDRDIYRLATHLLAVPTREDQSFLSCVHVGGVMTYAPVTIPPTASLREAIATMLDHGTAALPVVDGGRLQGVVTATDLLRSILEVLEDGSSDSM